MATRAESVGQGNWFDARYWLTIQQLLLTQPTTKLWLIWPSTTGSERSGGYSCRGTKRSFSLLLSFGWSKLGLWAVRLSLWGTMTPTLTRQGLAVHICYLFTNKKQNLYKQTGLYGDNQWDNIINGDRSASLVELGFNHIGSIPSSYCYCRASVMYIALRGNVLKAAATRDSPLFIFSAYAQFSKNWWNWHAFHSPFWHLTCKYLEPISLHLI
jgi:hypothetical protein